MSEAGPAANGSAASAVARAQPQQPAGANSSAAPQDMLTPSLLFGNTPFTEEELHNIKKALDMPLDPALLNSKPVGGMPMHFIDGGKVIGIANDVFGFNGWSRTIKTLTIDYCGMTSQSKAEVIASAVVRIMLKDGSFHEDIGIGEAVMPTKAQAISKAKKQAVTDAVKRALRTYGNCLGNCLRDEEYVKEVKQVKSGKREMSAMDKVRTKDYRTHDGKRAKSYTDENYPPSPSQMVATAPTGAYSPAGALHEAAIKRPAQTFAADRSGADTAAAAKSAAAAAPKVLMTDATEAADDDFLNSLDMTGYA